MRWLVALVAAALLPWVAAAPAPAAAAPGPRPCSRGLVALTFDDGPSPAVTARMTRLLRREQVPATFFMVGTRAQAHPELVRLVARRGFAIGNHTWAHAGLTTLTVPEVRRSVRATQRALVDAGVAPTRLVRPPYGAADTRVQKVLTGLGLTSTLWTIDSRDWAGRTPQQIREAIVAAVRPHRTNLVLQHDGVGNSPATLRALPRLITALRERGYCFGSLDSAGRPVPPVPVARVETDPRRVPEGGRVPVTVRLDRPTSRATSVRVNGTAVRFGVGEQVARVRVRVPQDRDDEHGERLAIRLDRPRGVRLAGPTSVGVVDEDPAPEVTLETSPVVASPLGEVTARVGVHLDRASDRDLEVVARSPLGRASVTVPAGWRAAELTFPVPVGTPRDAVREVPVRLVGGASATLVVRPPTRTRAEAARALVAGLSWPRLVLPTLF